MRAFSEIDAAGFANVYYKVIQDEINKRGKDYILKVDEEEYIKYLIETYSLEPLVILNDTQSVAAPTKKKISTTDDWGYEHTTERYEFVVTYRFTGSSGIFNIHPSSRIMKGYDISVDRHSSTVSFKFTTSKQDVAEFNREKLDAYERAFCNLPYANDDINQIIKGFNDRVRNMFINTKDHFKTENDFFAAVNIQTNKNTASVFSAPTVKKREIVQPKIAEKTEFASEPTVSKEMYDEILKAIYDFGRNMEKKPSLYKGKGEEDLRDQFVLILETKYEGTTATGETFNHSGSTDIILKYSKDGSNLFVAECKIWYGASEMMKAIGQLLSYLTWRDSKVALMLFVQNQSFSDVLTTIKTEIVKHPNFKKTNGHRGESSFSYIFGLPQDKNKDVQLEIMAFHYHKK